MSYSEDELIQISALQHYVFCPRRAALVLLEQIWQDNLFTVEGSINHENVHSMNTEKRVDIKYSTGLDLRSAQYGLIGKADMVEFHKIDKDKGQGAIFDGLEGRWMPLIIEYKRGATKDSREYEVQLCAQALCLEEMFTCHMDNSYLYYAGSKRRLEVALDNDLRQRTKQTINCIRELISSRITPKAEYSSKCNGCSLIDVCLPKIMGEKSAESYIASLIKHGV